MRATRVGGSLSSSARAFGVKRQARPVMHNRRAASRAIAVQSKPFLPIHFVAFMTNPLSSVWTLAASRLTRWAFQPNRSYALIAPIDVEHHRGKEVALGGVFTRLRQIENEVNGSICV